MMNSIFPPFYHVSMPMPICLYFVFVAILCVNVEKDVLCLNGINLSEYSPTDQQSYHTLAQL